MDKATRAAMARPRKGEEPRREKDSAGQLAHTVVDDDDRKRIG
jgi:hypothetical protein